MLNSGGGGGLASLLTRATEEASTFSEVRSSLKDRYTVPEHVDF